MKNTRIATYCKWIFFLFTCIALALGSSKQAVAQTAIANPGGITPTLAFADSRAIGFPNGQTYTYTYSSWAACTGWGLPTVIPVINGNVTGACGTYSNVTFAATPASPFNIGATTNLAGGVAVYTGTTTYQYWTGSAWNTTANNTNVRLIVTVTNGSAQPMALQQQGAFIICPIPDGTYTINVNVKLQAYGPTPAAYATTGTGTTIAPPAGNTYTCASYANTWAGAIQLFNCISTNGQNICTQFPGTTNSWVFYSGVVPAAPATPTGAVTICAGGSATLTRTGTPTAGTTWYWQTSTTGTDVTNSGATFAVTPASTTTYYLRPRVGTCWGTASAGVTVTVVADPAATTPSISVPTVCAGLLSPSSVLSSTASGGTGAYTFQWQYYNGSTWVTASNGTPTGAVYTVGGVSPASTLTITTAPTTAGSHQYRLRVTQTASGCEGFSAGTTLTVVADPTAPTLNVATPATGSTVCVGATVSATFNVSSNGTGTCTNEYQSTVNNGTTWLAYTPGTNLTAGATGTNWIRIQSRRVCSGNGCDGAGETYATVAQWTVVADAAAPTATKSPNAVTVCAGATLTLTGPTAGTGGTGTCNFEYRHSTDNGTNWTAWSTTVSSFAAVTGTNLIQIRRNCNGLGCDISPSTQYSWTVVNDPTTPTATKSPNVTDVCVGQTLTLTAPTSSNGTGTCNFEYRHSTNNGGTWTAWSTTVSSFAAVAGTNLIEIRRNCNGSGCDISGSTQYSWTVAADPTAPTLLLATPTSGTTICIGGTASATFNVSSNGTGTCTNNYRSSIDGGTTWLTYTPGTNLTAVTAGANRIQIQTSRTCDGLSCDGAGETYATVAQWTVAADPLITTHPTPSSTICSGGTVSLTGVVTPVTGPVYTYEWQESNDNGSSDPWATAVGGSGVNTLSYISPALTSTIYYRLYITSSSNGCTTPLISNSALVTVVADPAATTPTITNATVCVGALTSPYTVLSSTASGGTGAYTFQWQYFNGVTWVTASNGTPTGAVYTVAGTTPTSTLTITTAPTTAGTHQYRLRVTQTASGCEGFSAGTTLTVVADPTAPTLNVATPATGSTVCVGATVSATFNVSSNGTGTCTDEYQSTINNGTTWLAYTPGTNLTAGATGTNWIRIQSRRVCSGNGCDGAGETFATVAQWTVVADATAPTATKSPNVVTVCAGATLTLTGPTAGTGGTGTCNFEYRHSTDNGTNWTAWSTTVSSFAAVTGTNLIQIRRNCNGLGCDISPSTQYSWTVVNDPSPPTATQSPVATNVCVGQTLTLTSPLSSNGTGTCNFEYRHSTNNGGTWTAWSTTVSSFAAVAGTNLIEIRRNCNGTGCDISTATQYSWTVSADPTAPTLLAASPTSGTNVCIGDQVSATFNAGSNGTGTCTDNYRYSIDGATTWATYTPGNPITAVTAGTNRIQIQVSRTCDGTNCDGTGETFATVAQWTVLSNITGATFTYTNPYSCTTSNGTVTVSGATGGSGTYQYSINGGASWQASASFTGLADGLSGTVMVRNSTSPNCPVTVGSFTLQEPYEPIAAPTAASNISNLCSSNIATLTASGLEPGSGGNNSGGAYSYNGTNQYYYNASIAGFPTGSVATVEAWVNPVNSQADLTYNGIVSFGPNPSTNYNRFLMSIQSNGVPSFANWNNDFVPTAANCAALPWGQWSHLCMVLNGTGANNISFYINGNLAVTGTTNNAALTNLIASGRITIGCTDPAGGRYFEGSIANVRVWNVARTQAQIQADMYLEVPTVATGLVARYNFNANANCQNNVTYNLTAVNAPASVTPAFYTYTWTGAVPSGSNPTPSTNEVQTSGPLTGTSSMQVTASANGCNSIQSTAVPINDFGGAYTVALEAAGSGNAVNVVLPGNSTGPAYGRPGVGAETSAITASGGGAWDRCVNWGLPVTSNATYGPRVGFGSANTNMSYLAQGQPNSTTNLANGVVCYTASVAPPANRFCLTTTCTSWLSANLNIRVTLTLLTPANAAIPLDYTSSGHIVMRAGQNFKIRQKVEIQAPAAAYYGSGVNSGGGVGCNNYSTAGTWYPILEWYDCIYKSTAPQFYYSFNYNSFPKFTFTSGIDAGPDFTICVGGQPASRIDLQGDLGSLSATCGTLLHFWEGPSGYVNAGTLLAPSGTQSPATFLTSTSPTTFGTYNYTVSQGPAGTSNICYGTSSVNITQNVAVVNGGIWSNGAVGTTYYGTPVPAYLDPTSQVTGNDSWYDNRNWDHCVPDAATNSYILYNATNPANINSNVAGYWGANAATKFLKIDVPNNAKLMINANGTTKLNVTD